MPDRRRRRGQTLAWCVGPQTEPDHAVFGLQVVKEL